DGTPVTRLVFRNNLLARGMYGVFGSGKGEGRTALGHYAPNADFRGNIVVGAPATAYPADNSYPQSPLSVQMVDYAGGNYDILSSSPYATAGTGGSEPGANVPVLRQMLSNVR